MQKLANKDFIFSSVANSEIYKVTDEDRDFFSNRINKVVEEVGTNIASKEKIQKTFCEIMVQPLLAKYQVSLESKSI